MRKCLGQLTGPCIAMLKCPQIARFAKRVLPLISGRVLAQTSPSHAYDEEYVVENARRYARAFNAEGITK